MAELSFDVMGNSASFINGVEQMCVVIQKLSFEFQKVEKEGDNLSFSFKKVWKSIDGTTMLKKFVSDIIKVRGEFQQFETSFAALLQDKSKADILMSQIMEMATKSPFTVTELANGVKQLLSYGLGAEEMNNTLSQLGDIALGVGAPLENLASLYGTIMSQGTLCADDLDKFNNMGISMLQGLADIYGVNAEKIGEMVSAGKIGFPEVQKVMGNLTNEGGQFYNMMDVQSDTIQGKINNLGDAWSIMLNKIGQSQEGAINDSLDGIQFLIENYELIGKILLSLIETYGVYRAACIAHILLTQSLATTQLELGAVLFKLKKSFSALMATMNLNPWVLATTVVIGLAVAMWNLADHTSAAERAQERYNESVKKNNEIEQEHKRHLEQLVSVLQNECTAEARRQEIINEIKQDYPTFFKFLLDEKGNINDLTEAWKAHNEETSKNRVLKNKENFSSLKVKIAEEKRFLELFNMNLSDRQKNIKSSNADANIWKTYIGKGTRNVKKQIEEDEKLLWEYEKDVRNDEFVKWQLDLKNKTDKQINAIRSALVRRAQTAQGDKYLLAALNKRISAIDDEKQLRNPKVEIKNESYWNKQRETAEKALKAIGSSERRLLESGNFEKVDVSVVENYKRQKGLLQEAQNELSVYSNANTNSNFEQEDQLREMQTRLEDLITKQSLSRKNLEIELENKNRQSEIDAMDEGADKVLAQMELNHDKEIQELEREKEDTLRQKIENAKTIFDAEEAIKAKQNPKYKPQEFDASAIKLSDTETASFEDRETNILQKQAKERIAFVKSEERSMKEYLATYGDYEQKRQAIIDLAEEKKKGKNKGEQDMIDAETQKTLSELDSKANESTSAFGKLFSDMSDRSVKDMRKIAAEAQKALEFIKEGEWDPQIGKSFGMTEATFKELKKSNTDGLNDGKIKSIEDNIKNVNSQADASETAFNKMGNGFKKAFAAGADTKSVQEGLAEIEQGLNGVMQAAQFLSNSLAGIGDAFGNDTMTGIAEGIGVAMDAVGGAMEGAKAGAAFGPWGAAAGAAIGLVSSLSSSLAKMHDAKNEKRIQVMQEQVETLEKAYGNLGEAVEKAYSADASELIDQQNKMLEQQKVLIQNQIIEEKNKKKSDDGRIKEWEEQLEAIDKQIGQNKEKQIDAIMGSDLKSAIDDFAQAYADAWSAGNDRAKSSKDLVKDMIKQMIMESLKAASSEPMEKLRKKLAEFYKDGIISAWEREQIEKDAEAITKDLDSKYGWADEYLRGEEEGTSQADASKGGFETMSQETGEELNGRFTALQISNEEIRNSMTAVLGNLSSLCTTASDGNVLLSEMRNLAVMSNGHLEDIAKHTKVLLGFGEKLDRIEQNTGRI